jgi:glycosyltransferase involved in cell wall biosynthesis
MKVCYFGNYKPDYSRNLVLIKGLRENGIKVIECNNRSKGLLKFWRLFLKHLKIRNKYDVMIVGFPGQTAVLLAKILTRKKIIFDAFVSLYDSNVFDRQIYSAESFRAKYYWFLDWFTCRLADKILLDTNEQIKYFISEFKIKQEKFSRLFVGADDNLMKPREILSNNNLPAKPSGKILVFFYGNYIPLQGAKYIIESANILKEENFHFNLLGSGQDYQGAIELAREFGLKNITFLPRVSYEKLSLYINQADICLGIFGQTPKTQRVIPNKVFDYLACAKPFITAETPAIKELLEDKVHCLFCETANASDLAKKILELKNNNVLREKIAQNGYKLYQEKLTPKVLGKILRTIVEEVYEK